MTFDTAYYDGKISRNAKQIYDVLRGGGKIPVHDLKRFANFGKDSKPEFERGLTELQTRLFITMCGAQQKQSLSGEGYGCSSTVFCTAERFWEDSDVFSDARKISPEKAEAAITKRVLSLNPNAVPKKIVKFIRG